MVPYVVDDPNRFFGSLIIDIYSGYEEIVFESVTEAVPSLPAAYRVPMKDMGFLTLPGIPTLSTNCPADIFAKK